MVNEDNIQVINENDGEVVNNETTATTNTNSVLKETLMQVLIPMYAVCALYIMRTMYWMDVKQIGLSAHVVVGGYMLIALKTV